MTMETVSVPMLMLAVAAGAALFSQPRTAKRLAKEAAGTCQSKYCGPREMFVDAPKNTLLKDQSLGVGLMRPKTLPTATVVFKKLESDFMREQLRSPGVNLVAHAIA